MMREPDLSQVQSIMSALKFRGARPEGLRRLTDSQWQNLLPLCDQMHLTIPLRQTCEDDLPGWVRERIDQNICDNKERHRRIKAIYLEIANGLRDQGVEHLVLKGFSQSPAFVDEPSLRMQSDLDIFCPEEAVFRARDVLYGLGYAADQGVEHQPSDHLPTLRRKTDWSWRGNHFDPEMPVSVELHFRFWNEKSTRLRPRGLDQFWARRVERRIDDCTFFALSAADSVAYSALHVFHHLMGGLIPYHVYELARFLQRNADNAAFWREWHDLHDVSLRRLSAVCFHLAIQWFDCRVPQAVQDEIRHLPASARLWFDKYSDSPLASVVRPNKDALWLHSSMTESSWDRLLVLCGGLFPVRVPPLEAVRRWSLRAYARFLKHSVTRVAFHLRSLPRTIWAGLR